MLRIGKMLGFGGTSANDYSRQGLCHRLQNVLCGVCVGFFILTGSLTLIFWNEIRLVDALKIVDEAQRSFYEYPNCNHVNSGRNGQLVHVTCDITSATTIDPIFGIVGPSPSLRLQRIVETYQWKQKSLGKMVTNASGTTFCLYYVQFKTWSANYNDTDRFHRPGKCCTGLKQNADFCNDPCEAWVDCHNLPPRPEDTSATFLPSGPVQAGPFILPVSLVDQPWSLVVNVTDQKPVGDPARLIGPWFYVSRSEKRGKRPESPSPGRVPPGFNVAQVNNAPIPSPGFVASNAFEAEIGDVRYRWIATVTDTVSILARQRGNSFDRWHSEKEGGLELYEINEGHTAAQDMMQAIHPKDTTQLHLWRMVGFILCWFALQLIVGPFSVAPKMVPCIGHLLGNLAGHGLCCFNFLVAVSLTLLFAAIAWLFYQPIIGVPLLLGSLVIAATLCAFMYARVRRKTNGTLPVQLESPIAVQPNLFTSSQIYPISFYPGSPTHQSYGDQSVPQQGFALEQSYPLPVQDGVPISVGPRTM